MSAHLHSLVGGAVKRSFVVIHLYRLLGWMQLTMHGFWLLMIGCCTAVGFPLHHTILSLPVQSCCSMVVVHCCLVA